MKFYHYPIYTATVMNANLTSSPMQLQEMYGFTIQATYTGTPTGTFKLQVSSDPVNKNGIGSAAPTNWTDLANSSAAVSAAGNYMWNVTDVFFNWVRLIYTDGSSGASTAVLSAQMNGKGI